MGVTILINQRLEEVLAIGSPQANLYERKFQNLYEAYKADGLFERLVTDENSIGMIGAYRGFDLLDLHEGLLEHGSERDWLEHLSRADFSGINLSPKQLKTLRLRLKKLREIDAKNHEQIMFSEEDVIRRAIQIARKANDELVEDQLTRMLKDYADGLSRCYHNIGRGGFITKFNPQEIKDGKQSHTQLLKKILGSENPSLIPRQGTYVKGTYLQSVNFVHDNPLENYGFILEEYLDEVGMSNTVLTEYLKNMGSNPLVLDFASVPMPKFKHQVCAIKYVNTSLNEELRRVIVSIPEEKMVVEAILKKAGMENVQVLQVDSWLREVKYLKQAQDQLNEELGLE